MSELDLELGDPIAATIEAMSETEFIVMLNEALTGPLDARAFSVKHGHPCFWGVPPSHLEE